MGDEHVRKAGILSIGNELLNGRTVDTNAAYIAGRLRSISLPVVSVHTVPDEIDAIVVRWLWRQARRMSW